MAHVSSRRCASGAVDSRNMIRKDHAPQGVEEKLDLIIEYLRRNDRRERWRVIGGTIRSIISILPILLVLWFAWYLQWHGKELLQNLTISMAKNMSVFSEGNTNRLLQEFLAR